MKEQSKPIVNPKALGLELRKRRKTLGRTLTEISVITSINVGQLSRLENGHMKRDGGNLQKLLLSLQELETVKPQHAMPNIVERFEAIIKRSNRHAEAAMALVDALEQLM